MDFISLAGPNRVVQIFGIKLVGVNAENATKFLVSLAFIIIVLILGKLLKKLADGVLAGPKKERTVFWIVQGIRLSEAIVLVIGIASIWFDNPARLVTAIGLITAGIAFALQKVITAVAGYFVILRGNTFNVGDRIKMGGVRGDVVALSFIQTTIMEMGEPPAVQADDPAMWVRSRQYTGRIVTVTNDKIFAEPVYNYTRDFPYIWEEMHFPVTYRADRAKAERILLEAAERHTVSIREMSEDAIRELQRRYFVKIEAIKPAIYYRMTDNWLELTLRFIAGTHDVRELKSAMSRDILAAFDSAGIGIASATYDVVGFPPVRIENADLKKG